MQILTSMQGFCLHKLTQSLGHLFPTCCAFCFDRGQYSICPSCLRDLLKSLTIKKCIICGTPNPTWICKYCLHAQWAFDQSIVMCHASDRLTALVVACHEFGAIHKLPAILYAWQCFNRRQMAPVDLVIPLPEPFVISQKRGFWLALLLAKKWAQLVDTPYNRKMIFIHDNGNLSARAANIPSFYLNPQVAQMAFCQYRRVVIVMPCLLKEFVLHELAQLLKQQGVQWVGYWSLTRQIKKDFY